MMRRVRFGAVAGVVAALTAGSALAQGRHPAPPGPGRSFVADRDQDQPIQIEAVTLELRDKKKIATFSGNVQVVQGDTTIKCQTLIVHYGREIGISSDRSSGSTKQSGTLPDQQNIRLIEARGGVTVVSKDQKASGDVGVYDLHTKTITLTGNVVVSQGPNVIHGERVVVDTVTGNARVESDANVAQGRVRALIVPSKGQNGGPTNFITIGPGQTN
jgi:lipopolysaccharide export system protein LptA